MKKGPEKIEHSASWNKHRNKWQSKEYWGKIRMAGKKLIKNFLKGKDD